MSKRNDLRKVCQELIAQGWEVRRTNRGHYQFIPPNLDAEIVVHSGSASECRAFRNCLARLRKSGAEL